MSAEGDKPALGLRFVDSVLSPDTPPLQHFAPRANTRASHLRFAGSSFSDDDKFGARSTLRQGVVGSK